MGRINRKTLGTHVHEIKAKIQSLISNNYPDCSVEFVGAPGGNIRRRSFGFRLLDAKGKYRTKTIWIGPSFYHHPNKEWLVEAVERATGL